MRVGEPLPQLFLPFFSGCVHKPRAHLRPALQLGQLARDVAPQVPVGLLGGHADQHLLRRAGQAGRQTGARMPLRSAASCGVLASVHPSRFVCLWCGAADQAGTAPAKLAAAALPKWLTAARAAAPLGRRRAPRPHPPAPPQTRAPAPAQPAPRGKRAGEDNVGRRHGCGISATCGAALHTRYSRASAAKAHLLVRNLLLCCRRIVAEAQHGLLLSSLVSAAALRLLLLLLLLFMLPADGGGDGRAAMGQ